MFVIDRSGNIAYAGAPGPWGFRPDDIAEWLATEVGAPASLEGPIGVAE